MPVSLVQKKKQEFSPKKSGAFFWFFFFWFVFRASRGNGSQQRPLVAVQVVFFLYIMAYEVVTSNGVYGIPQVESIHRVICLLYTRPSHSIPISILILSELSLPWGSITTL